MWEVLEINMVEKENKEWRGCEREKGRIMVWIERIEKRMIEEKEWKEKLLKMEVGVGDMKVEREKMKSLGWVVKDSEEIKK